jgi:hypothetical protein
MVDRQVESMGSENTEDRESPESQDQTPVCLRCIRPVDPLAHYCPHCGEATAQLTPIIPFVNIPWQTRIWGRMWRQVWSHEVSIPGRLMRLIMIVAFAPVLLIGLLFKPWRKPNEPQDGRTQNEDAD